MTAAAPLAPREAYRLWAPVYEAETAISYMDERLVRQLTPPLAGKRLLDAGCGTGRRLRAQTDTARAVGADLTWEMLAAGASSFLGRSAFLAAADVRALPFAPATFDVVWCRLVLGHLASIAEAYAELARVAAPGGTVVVTDFHPDAVGAGHTRSFRDSHGMVRDVEHHVHAPEDHVRAAGAAGMAPIARRDGEVGPEVRPFYACVDRLDRYQADLRLPIVLAMAFRAPGRASADRR